MDEDLPNASNGTKYIWLSDRFQGQDRMYFWNHGNGQQRRTGYYTIAAGAVYRDPECYMVCKRAE